VYGKKLNKIISDFMIKIIAKIFNKIIIKLYKILLGGRKDG